jgi:hypothetical protein
MRLPTTKFGLHAIYARRGWVAVKTAQQLVENRREILRQERLLIEEGWIPVFGPSVALGGESKVGRKARFVE